MTPEYVMVPREAVEALLLYAEAQTCTHEETYRGGAIWTICRACGRKWADDEGGFVPYQDPPEIAAARAMLQAAPPAPAMHASAPTGMKCADCYMDKEACPTCYSAWWKARHPHSQQMPEGAPPAPVAATGFDREYVRAYLEELLIDKIGNPHTDPEVSKFLEWLAAPVAVQPAPVAWHDIASAPKDGTEILLYAPACEHQGKPVPQRITQGYWLTKKAYIREIRDLEGRYIDQDEFDGFDGWMSSDGGFTDEDPPTHWMPLPPAPDASPSPAPVADLLVTDAQIDEASERKAFEAWASDQGFLMQRTVHGDDYQDLRTQGPWEAWQARAILAAQSGAGTQSTGEQS